MKCKNCGTIVQSYMRIDTDPPSYEGVCPKCGGHVFVDELVETNEDEQHHLIECLNNMYCSQSKEYQDRYKKEYLTLLKYIFQS